MSNNPDPFSKDHIAKKVNDEILNDSFTLIPSALGILGLLWGGLFSSGAALIIGALALTAGAANFFLNKFKRVPKLTEKHITKAREQQKKLILQKLDSLGPELSELGCHQGTAQVDMLRTKFQDLNALIIEKLDSEDSRSQRIAGLAEKLYLATIENLDHARQILKSVQNIDLEYIDSQIARAHSDEEKESLTERKNLKLKGIDESENCIAKNEVAMTKLNLISMQLAKQKKGTHIDMESSLHEITNNVRIDQWESH